MYFVGRESWLLQRDHDLFLFSSPFSFRMICVRYRIEICEKVSISLWTLLGGILRLRSLWVVVAWMDPRMYVRLIVGGRSK